MRTDIFWIVGDGDKFTSPVQLSTTCTHTQTHTLINVFSMRWRWTTGYVKYTHCNTELISAIPLCTLMKQGVLGSCTNRTNAHSSHGNNLISSQLASATNSSA